MLSIAIIAVRGNLSGRVGLVDLLTSNVVANVAAFDTMLATEVAISVAGNREGPATDDPWSNGVCADITISLGMGIFVRKIRALTCKASSTICAHK
jgi:hypothetical protein